MSIGLAPETFKGSSISVLITAEVILDIAVISGRVLRKLRKAAELTQGQLAIEAALDPDFISMLERGQRQPTITTLIKLAAPLKTTAWKMVKLIENEINTRPHAEPE